MKRDAELLVSSNDGKRSIYIDKANAGSILAYFNKDDRHRKKFMFIAELILRGIKNSQVYDKEVVGHTSTSVTAMKFFKGQENDRIYCRELKTEGRRIIIVAVVLIEKKKTQKLGKQLKSLIEKIAEYEYEIK